jgi:aspartyl-tRNA(Asn)/glutamyl-tRNA(Gln) amidotransferase subunit B
LLEQGKPGRRETRGWNSVSKETFVLRTKETALDYRFMRDADIPGLRIQNHVKDQLKDVLPEIPSATKYRFREMYAALAVDQVNWLVDGNPYFEPICTHRQEMLRERYLDTSAKPQTPLTLSAHEYFEEMMAYAKQVVKDQDMALPCFHWLSGELMGRLLKTNTLDMNHTQALWKLSPAQLSSIPCSIANENISGKAGKIILDEMLASPSNLDATQVAEKLSISLIRDPIELKSYAASLIEKFPPRKKMKRAAYVSWIVGKVLSETKGRAHPTLTRSVVENECMHFNE